MKRLETWFTGIIPETATREAVEACLPTFPESCTFLFAFDGTLDNGNDVVQLLYCEKRHLASHIGMEWEGVWERLASREYTNLLSRDLDDNGYQYGRISARTVNQRIMGKTSGYAQTTRWCMGMNHRNLKEVE